MPGIVCAIRGGPDSRPTIRQAIQLRQETGLPLIFLYVVNLDFLTHTSRSRIDTISTEMEQLGEFILLTAQSQAQEAGFPAEGVIRHGQVGEEIISLCKDKHANYVVLGRPKGEPQDNVFTQDAFTRFKQHIEQESGAQVVVVQGEES